MTASWFGDRAVRVEVPHGWTGIGLASGVAAALPALSVRAGFASILVEADDPDPGLLGAVEAVVAGLEPEPMPAARGSVRSVVIEVAYDGADLDELAQLLGVSTHDVVAAHRAQEWSVALMGFAPGFGYLVPVGPHELPWSRIPRRGTPRSQVPAGSVAVAAGMSAVYPAAMPGGWLLIGRTSAPLFDSGDGQDPTLLHPGDTVRFVGLAAP